MDVVTTYLVLLAVVAGTNGLRRAIPFPLPLLQMAAGVLCAWPGGMRVGIDPELFLLVFIPPLLFIDGFRIPKHEFALLRRTILSLAFGLVVISVLVVGFLLHTVMPTLPFFLAFGLASALSPTDAVAVSGISGRTRVPPRLMHLLQGEALMNDASGLVCLRVAVAALATGAFSWGSAAKSLVVVAVGGIAVGFGVAWLVGRAQRLVFGVRDDVPEARALVIVVLPFAAYLAAEHFHFSGILAAAAAGMVLPRVGLISLSQRVTRRQTVTVLESVELAFNGLVFVLLGLQLPGIVTSTPAVVAAAGLPSWTSLTAATLVASAGLFGTRLAFVWLLLRFSRRGRRAEDGNRVPFRIILATAFAGVRGTISLAGALILPLTVEDYPAREVAVHIAAGVIVISLLLASVGLPLSLRGVDIPTDNTKAERRAHLRAEMAKEAIAAVETARDASADLADAAAFVLDRYRARAERDEEAHALEDQIRELRLLAIGAERAHLQRLARARQVDEQTMRALINELDVLEEAFTKPAQSLVPGHH